MGLEELPDGRTGVELRRRLPETGHGECARPRVAAAVDDVEDHLAALARTPRALRDLGAEGHVRECGVAPVVRGPTGEGIGCGTERHAAAAARGASVERH